MSDTVFIFLLGVIFCIVAVCPYLAWKISEYDGDTEYYQRRRMIRIYMFLICLFIVLWSVVFFF
jgi:heme/copper-type cytochrome/quinol oxidase subunit 2